MDNLTLQVMILGMCAVVAVLIYSLIKSKRNGSDRTELQEPPDRERHIEADADLEYPADELANQPDIDLHSSPHYSCYRNLFDFISSNSSHPQYKIDWLLESLDMGHELEDNGFYVMDSIRNNLPYFCETESEFDLFFDSRAPVLKGSVEGILQMISFYFYNLKHPSKRVFWLELLQELAQNGNLEAQAALCTNRVKNFFSESEASDFKKKYEANLMRLAEAGNAEAQLAVGEFLMPTPPLKIKWLTKAAQQGLSDAWYQLGEAYGSKINITDDGQFMPDRLSQDEVRQLMVKETECLLNGAKANNGIMAAWCQYMAGRRYAEGEYLPMDLTQAAYWTQEAIKNGEERAESYLEYIGTLLSEQQG